MKNRVEIEEAENGCTVRVWKKEEDDKDDFGYCEPETFVAKTMDEALEIVKDNFKIKGDE